MIGTSSPMSICEISELFRICVDRSLGFRGPDHGADELGLQSGLAENCANELYTSTAVFATTPPRSSTSRIAASFTASATLSSVAIFSSARACVSVASAKRR